MTQAAEALLFLHTPDEATGRPRVVHRDFKPANILLDDRLQAMLSDTGFAKASKTGDATQASTLAGDVWTRGFADPLIHNTGEYSVVTDGYAVGVTLLVVLTNRSAQGLIDAVETEHDADLVDVAGAAIAEPAARFPAHVASALTKLTHGLCRVRKGKRLPLPEVLQTLRALQSAPASQPEDAGEAATAATEEAAPASDRSVLVRRMGRAAVAEDDEAQARLRLQRNASSAFDAAIRMLDARFKEWRGEAPDEFKERIDFYRRGCGLPPGLHERLHQLRRWRNAAEHQDEERWRREGPSGEGAFMALVREVTSGLEGA